MSSHMAGGRRGRGRCWMKPRHSRRWRRRRTTTRWTWMSRPWMWRRQAAAALTRRAAKRVATWASQPQRPVASKAAAAAATPAQPWPEPRPGKTSCRRSVGHAGDMPMRLCCVAARMLMPAAAWLSCGMTGASFHPRAPVLGGLRGLHGLPRRHAARRAARQGLCAAGEGRARHGDPQVRHPPITTACATTADDAKRADGDESRCARLNA